MINQQNTHQKNNFKGRPQPTPQECSQIPLPILLHNLSLSQHCSLHILPVPVEKMGSSRASPLIISQSLLTLCPGWPPSLGEVPLQWLLQMGSLGRMHIDRSTDHSMRVISVTLCSSTLYLGGVFLEGTNLYLLPFTLSQPQSTCKAIPVPKEPVKQSHSYSIAKRTCHVITT
jgi:hypothetical protein